MKSKCLFCKKQFDKRGPAKACSDECRDMLRHEYNKAHYQKNKERMKKVSMQWVKDNPKRAKKIRDKHYKKKYGQKGV